MHKILLVEYSVLNIYENFGGDDFSPGKIEFGVVVVRFFLVVRVYIPGVNCILDILSISQSGGKTSKRSGGTIGCKD